MTHRLLPPALLLAIGVLPLAACASLDDDTAVDDTAVDEAELRQSRVEVLGDIAPGTSVSVAYTAQPRYRAFHFDVATGEEVEFIAESAAPLRLYVLADNFRTMVSTTSKTLTYRPRNGGSYFIALATIDGSSQNVELTMVGESDVHRPPLAECSGDFTALEAQPAARAGEWLTLRHRAFTRECDESPAKTCTAWVEKPSLRMSAPQLYGSIDNLHKPFTTTVAAKDGAPHVFFKSTGLTSMKGEAPIQQIPEGSKLEVTIEYTTARTVCTDYSWGAGWGSGGCLRSTLKYGKGTLPTFRGNVSESCARLTSGVETSNVQEFGAGVVSYTETMHYFSAD